MSSAGRNENRLTTDDRVRMTTAVAAALAAWRHDSGPGWTPDAASRQALQRIGAHSIGCGVDDLRVSERDELDRIIDGMTS